MNGGYRLSAPVPSGAKECCVLLSLYAQKLRHPVARINPSAANGGILESIRNSRSLLGYGNVNCLPWGFGIGDRIGESAFLILPVDRPPRGQRIPSSRERS